MSKSKNLKILIPLLMLAIVVGLWFMKNKSENTEVLLIDKGEFGLTVSSIDLEKLKSHNLPIIIDFGADECVPCKQMAPVLAKINKEMEGKALIKFVDVWKSPEASKGFPVQVIPTQVFILADGKPYQPSENLGIKFNLYSTKDSSEHVFTTHQGGLTEEQMNLILKDMGVN